MVGNYNDCQVQPTGDSHTGEQINKFIGKRKTHGPADGITNYMYIADWKLTLEPEDTSDFSFSVRSGQVRLHLNAPPLG